jgi:hypothetical protein
MRRALSARRCVHAMPSLPVPSSKTLGVHSCRRCEPIRGDVWLSEYFAWCLRYLAATQP